MRSLWFGFLLLLAMLGSSRTMQRGLASTTSIDAVRGQAAAREQQAADHTPIQGLGKSIDEFTKERSQVYKKR